MANSNIDISENLLDEIRAALASPARVNRELLVDVAAEYSEACVDLNKRLRRIGTLLSKGLRTEAIQLSDQEPNVLEQVALLDFPERDHWVDLLRRIGIQIPPPLAMDIAEQIDDAYAVQWPLEQLLKKHRLLAIARAPLSIRLQILRKIREKDPANPAWVLDQQSWEKVRIKEIERELKSAVGQGDMDWIRRVTNEINHERWEIGLPASLVESANQAAFDAEVTRARFQLEEISKDLNSALSAFDVPKGLEARDRWNQQASIAQLDEQSDPLYLGAAEALAWLDDEESRNQQETFYQTQIYELEQAIDRRDSVDQIERIAYSIQSMDRELPEILQMRISEYRRGKETTSSRRFILALVAVFIVLAGIGLGVFYFISQNIYQNKVKNTVATLQQFQRDDELNAARGFIDNLDSNLKSESKVGVEVNKIEALLGAEQKRVTEFDEQINLIENAGFDEPNVGALAVAKELAKTDAEQKKVRNLKTLMDDRQFELLSERNRDFHEKLRQFQKAVQSVGMTPSSIERLKSIQADCKLLKRGSSDLGYGLPRVDRAIVKQIDPVISRIEQKIGQIKSKEAEAAQLKLVEFKGDITAFTNELSTFARTYPDSEISDQFTKTANETKFVDGYLQWQQLMQSVRWSRIASLSTTKAKRLITRASELATDFPNHASQQRWDERATYLRAITKRVGQDENEKDVELIDNLISLFNEPHIARSHLGIETTTGIRYLMPKLPANFEKAREPTIVYYNGQDLVTAKRTLKRNEKESFKNYKFPYQQMCIDVRDRLGKVRDGELGWEEGFALALHFINKPNPIAQTELDPILKMSLIQRVVADGSKGSPIFAKEFAAINKKLSNTDVQLSTDWIRPDDSASGVREEARQFIARQIDISTETLTKYHKSMQSQLSKYTTAPPTPIVALGCLMPTEDSWEVRITATKRTEKFQNGDLFLIANNEQDKLDAIKIGSISAGVPKLSNTSLMQAGRIVFFRGSPTEPKTSSKTSQK